MTLLPADTIGGTAVRGNRFVCGALRTVLPRVGINCEAFVDAPLIELVWPISANRSLLIDLFLGHRKQFFDRGKPLDDMVRAVLTQKPHPS
jgi:hypothetical protein